MLAIKTFRKKRDKKPLKFSLVFLSRFAKSFKSIELVSPIFKKGRGMGKADSIKDKEVNLSISSLFLDKLCEIISQKYSLPLLRNCI